MHGVLSEAEAGAKGFTSRCKAGKGFKALVCALETLSQKMIAAPQIGR